VEYVDGGKQWYRHGQLHRDDEPTVQIADRYEAFFRHGMFYQQ